MILFKTFPINWSNLLEKNFHDLSCKPSKSTLSFSLLILSIINKSKSIFKRRHANSELSTNRSGGVSSTSIIQTSRTQESPTCGISWCSSASGRAAAPRAPFCARRGAGRSPTTGGTLATRSCPAGCGLSNSTTFSIRVWERLGYKMDDSMLRVASPGQRNRNYSRRRPAATNDGRQ